MSFYIDIHALQTLPPSNINRDDTGSPKSAVFGGVPRQRVSSQAWKSAIRQDFVANLDTDKMGIRTKRVAEKVVTKIQEISEGYDYDQALSEVAEAFKFPWLSPKRRKKKRRRRPWNPVIFCWSATSRFHAWPRQSSMLKAAN